MAELKERELQILLALSQLAEPTRPTEIGQLIGEIPLNTGRALAELSKGELAVQTDKEQNLWAITKTGRDYLEEHKQLTESVPLVLETGRKEPPPGEETVPSQADLFKAEGQRIGFGSRKGDIKLEAVVNYVERIADLDDLTSIWNALTEMGVANDVKKRWIKLYAQNLPNKEIPEELKERLEVGHEEKVTTEGAVATKPKRFSVVNSQIIGDPEGDYNFKEALQIVAQEKGASPAQAAEMAATFAKMNTDTLNLIIPQVTKAPEGDSVIKLILTQMSDLQKEMRAASSQGQGSEVQALSKQLSELRDTLHNEQLARIQEQNQATTKELIGYIKSLDSKIEAATKGKQAESKIGLLSDALHTGAEELRGIRSDLKPLAQSFMERGAAPGEKTAAEKARFGTGLDKGIERAHEATELENELFFGQA